MLKNHLQSKCHIFFCKFQSMSFLRITEKCFAFKSEALLISYPYILAITKIMDYNKAVSSYFLQWLGVHLFFLVTGTTICVFTFLYHSCLRFGINKWMNDIQYCLIQTNSITLSGHCSEESFLVPTF